jgi:hypothetical protein
VRSRCCGCWLDPKGLARMCSRCSDLETEDTFWALEEERRPRMCIPDGHPMSACRSTEGRDFGAAAARLIGESAPFGVATKTRNSHFISHASLACGRCASSSTVRSATHWNGSVHARPGRFLSSDLHAGSKLTGRLGTRGSGREVSRLRWASTRLTTVSAQMFSLSGRGDRRRSGDQKVDRPFDWLLSTSDLTGLPFDEAPRRSGGQKGSMNHHSAQ